MSFADEPVPRTVPKGATSHPGDTVTIVWGVIFACISVAGAVYATQIAYHSDTQAGGAGVALVFFLFSALVWWRFTAGRNRRAHALRFGKAVSAEVLMRVRVSVRSSGGAYAGSYFNLQVAFEDKETWFNRIENGRDTPNLYVDGKWVALWAPGERVELAKWTLRKPKH